MKDGKAGRLSWLFTLPLLQANTAWYPTAFQITALYPSGGPDSAVFLRDILLVSDLRF